MAQIRRPLALGLLFAVAVPPLVASCSSADSHEADEGARTAAASGAFARTQCDVINAGGSTAALSAALAAADRGAKVFVSPTADKSKMESQQHVCLIEPTDWPGGQLTASLVSAIDFSHQLDGRGRKVGPSHNALVNNAPLFHRWINDVGAPKAICWVTASGCFEPVNMLNKNIVPELRLKEARNLTVFRNAVVKRVERSGRYISAVTIVEREVPKARRDAGDTGYTRFFSADVLDWYSTANSVNFTKTVTRLTGRGGRVPVVIDATEFGDVLVLSGASYLQGVEEINSSKISDQFLRDSGGDLNNSGLSPYIVDKHGQGRVGNRPPWGTKKPVPPCGVDGACRGYDEAGQQIVYPFIAKLHSAPVADNSPSVTVTEKSKRWYKPLVDKEADRVWRYRRIKGSGATASAEDLSLQNYNPGNDYPFGYLLLGMEETEAQKSDWKGGINVETLRGAEAHSIGWFRHFRDNTPAPFKGRLSLHKAGTGTSHGLSKMPYVRDTRRSIGWDVPKTSASDPGKTIPGSDQFVLKYQHLARLSANGVTAHPFRDTIAIGSYVVDIHPVAYEIKPLPVTNYLNEKNTYPYFIPFRALTNRDVDNLLVAGKTMAQTFHANAAIRLQPEEWNTGAAAGVAATHMLHYQEMVPAMVKGGYKDIQAIVSGKAGGMVHSPIKWTLSGETFPR